MGRMASIISVPRLGADIASFILWPMSQSLESEMIRFEHTDTFGGEANYAWVRRGEYKGNKEESDLSLVRAVKKFAGFTGIKCRVDHNGDMIAIYPSGLCQVCFIIFEY
jgi:hypothetical protein